MITAAKTSLFKESSRTVRERKGRQGEDLQQEVNECNSSRRAADPQGAETEYRSSEKGKAQVIFSTNKHNGYIRKQIGGIRGAQVSK